jgi:hypothetical protein
MFSEMMKNLRKEAERASEANSLMLVHSRKQGWDLVDKVSGQTTQNMVRNSGLGMGMGGVIGLMGVAMANQAAALGAAGLLSTASTAMATLGSVAIGSAVLPVATVAVLGTAVAGLALVGVSQFMKVDYEKAAQVESALKSNDRDTLAKIGREDVGIKDWLKGVGSVAVKLMRGQYLGSSGKSIEAEALGDASLDYELEDLFSTTVEQTKQAQAQLVEKISGDIYDRLGVVVTDDKLHACLGKTRNHGVSCGKILEVDTKTGLVIQSSGRGQATVHNLKDFKSVPLVGKDITVSYKGGAMQEPQEQGQSRFNGVGR